MSPHDSTDSVSSNFCSKMYFIYTEQHIHKQILNIGVIKNTEVLNASYIFKNLCRHYFRPYNASKQNKYID